MTVWTPRVPYLSEEEVSVCAVPLLLLPSLQQHQCLGLHSVCGLQGLAEASAVLCKQGSRHPQSVLPQPVHCSVDTRTTMTDKRSLSGLACLTELVVNINL